ncbi:hypothetical protein HPB48_005460 [Haemaphysalis longicornis]|uniref:GH18 domain-containing protein n=1 Tax=Haemaphysalis longicornis TaxID=44386 RepID=A0A9J6H666_HAELO|nr:hypothetical protein HPB48_005460 [Haemaphysalis longicornis]
MPGEERKGAHQRPTSWKRNVFPTLPTASPMGRVTTPGAPHRAVQSRVDEELLGWMDAKKREQEAKRFDCFVASPRAMRAPPPSFEVVKMPGPSSAPDHRRNASLPSGAMWRAQRAGLSTQVPGATAPSTGLATGVAASQQAKAGGFFGSQPWAFLAPPESPAGAYGGTTPLGNGEAVPIPVSAPRTPPARSDAEARPLSYSTNIIFSSDLEDSSERPRGPQRRKRCAFRYGTLCIILLAIVLVPIALFLLSYYITPRVTEVPTFTIPSTTTAATYTTPTATTTHSPTRTSTMTTSATPTSQLTSTTTLGTTVPPACLAKGVINTNIFGLNVSGYRTFNFGVTPSYKINHTVFCLYNNSRFRRDGLYDFVPENLPLHYCRYVVYWSFGTSNGILASRATDFDKHYGLEKLRDTLLTNNLTQQVGVLVALGGYPEDGHNFRQLGGNNTAMARFVSSVLQTIALYRLEGVTIHWVFPDSTCQQPDDPHKMSALVDRLRESYELNGFNRELVTAIIPADTQLANSFVSVLADKLDYYLFETHLITPPPVVDYQLCGHVASSVVQFFASVPFISGRENKTCAGLSLAPWALRSSPMPVPSTLVLADDASNYTALPGTTAVFEFCQGDGPCLDAAQTDCNVIYVRDNTMFAPVSYLFHAKETLLRIFSPGSVIGSATNGNYCAVLYDIDMDNYATPCPDMTPSNTSGERFISLEHFYNSISVATTDLLQDRILPC